VIYLPYLENVESHVTLVLVALVTQVTLVAARLQVIYLPYLENMELHVTFVLGCLATMVILVADLFTIVIYPPYLENVKSHVAFVLVALVTLVTLVAGRVTDMIHPFCPILEIFLALVAEQAQVNSLLVKPLSIYLDIVNFWNFLIESEKIALKIHKKY